MLQIILRFETQLPDTKLANISVRKHLEHYSINFSRLMCEKKTPADRKSNMSSSPDKFKDVREADELLEYIPGEDQCLMRKILNHIIDAGLGDEIFENPPSSTESSTSSASSVKDVAKNKHVEEGRLIVFKRYIGVKSYSVMKYCWIREEDLTQEMLSYLDIIDDFHVNPERLEEAYRFFENNMTKEVDFSTWQGPSLVKKIYKIERTD